MVLEERDGSDVAEPVYLVVVDDTVEAKQNDGVSLPYPVAVGVLPWAELLTDDDDDDAALHIVVALIGANGGYGE